MMPPHDVHVGTHPGGGAVMQRKPPALRDIGIDGNARSIDDFRCDCAVELIHGCRHRFPAGYPFRGREPVHADPPYLQATRRPARRYRHDMTDEGHVELPGIPCAPCRVMLSGCPSDPCGGMLEGRGSPELQLANQAGVAAGKLRFDFFPDRVHRAGPAGRNFTDRPGRTDRRDGGTDRPDAA